jgi:hypothetical protein
VPEQSGILSQSVRPVAHTDLQHTKGSAVGVMLGVVVGVEEGVAEHAPTTR